LWALLAHVDLGHAKELVDHLSLPLLAAGTAAFLATSPFSALRWHIVLAAETISPRPWTLLKIVLVGMFFNQVLPSGVGGDAVRAWRCHRLGIGVAAAIRSLVLDRFSGYFVMVVLFGRRPQPDNQESGYSRISAATLRPRPSRTSHSRYMVSQKGPVR
jgi:uncharacterized protein (TIRG00374 family)